MHVGDSVLTSRWVFNRLQQAAIRRAKAATLRRAAFGEICAVGGRGCESQFLADPAACEIMAI